MHASQFSGFGLLLLARASVAAVVQYRQAPDFSDASYGWSPETIVSIQGTPEFENATERWDIYMEPTYSVAISPASEADVVTAVKAAQEHGLPLLATGGRHGFSTTLGQMKGGVAIDLSQLDSVVVDKNSSTLTIGGGVHFGQVFDPVYNAGFQVPTGTASCPGMVSVTVGGGIGRLNGLDGMVLDSLLSVRIVTANGTLLEASETSNSDLFWGIRGAGHNFGVIVSATYQLYPLYNGGDWTSVDLIVPLEKNVSYFDAVASLLPLPAQLTVQTMVTYNTATNQTQLMASLVYGGSQEDALKAMAPVLDLGPFDYQNVSTIAWNKLASEAMFQIGAAICVRGGISDVYGFNLKAFDAPTWSSSLQKMSDFYAANPDARGSVILLESWPNEAVQAVPEDETAYPWRDVTTYGLIQFRWGDLGDVASQTAANSLGPELRSDFAATSGYDGLTVYVNYAAGDESLEQIYGDKLPRLASLKAKYDPDNVFKFYHALPTSYP
ncbi:Type I Iterative PKS [Pestalotiopsis sp. IQ-011]